MKPYSTEMDKQNLGPLFLPSKLEKCSCLMLHIYSLLAATTCDLFHSFKVHTHTLLSSHSPCLCKTTLSSMTSSYAFFSLNRAWILLSLFSLFQRFLFSTCFSPQLHFMVVTHLLSLCLCSSCLNPLFPFSATLHTALFHFSL